MQPVWNLLNDQRRVAGICGIAFTVLFIVAAFFIIGTTPTADASSAEINEYFAGAGSDYLTGDMIFGFAVVLFFVTFIVALRGILLPVDPSGGLWANLSLAGALVAVILGGAGAAPLTSIAFIGPENVDDSTLRLAIVMSQVSTSAVGLGFAVTMISVAVIVAQTGVLWRWMTILAVLSAVLGIVGMAWIPAKEPDGVLAGLSLAGISGAQLFMLLASIQLLLPSKSPVPAPHAAAAISR